MATFFIQGNKPNKIEALEIEVTLSENHEFTNNITSYPVDAGFNITDHIQQLPPRLTITGLTSNTPVQYVTITKIIGGQLQKRVTQEDLTNRIYQTFNLLIGYAGFVPPKHGESVEVKIGTPKLLTIVTGLMIYKNMAIQRISFPRDKGTGESLQYTIDLIQVRKVSSQYTYINVASNQSGKAPNIEKQAAKTANTGKQVADPASESSPAYNAYLALKGIIK